MMTFKEAVEKYGPSAVAIQRLKLNSYPYYLFCAMQALKRKLRQSGLKEHLIEFDLQVFAFYIGKKIKGKEDLFEQFEKQYNDIVEIVNTRNSK